MSEPERDPRYGNIPGCCVVCDRPIPEGIPANWFCCSERCLAIDTARCKAVLDFYVGRVLERAAQAAEAA